MASESKRNAARESFLEFYKHHSDGIVLAGVAAWNLREWLREVSVTPSLRPVLQELVRDIRTQLELGLVDSGLASFAENLPDGENLTAVSLIAFVEGMRFPGGSCLRVPAGKPLHKWKTLSRYRAMRIAVQLVERENGPLIYDYTNEDDLDAIEAADDFLLSELWRVIDRLGHPLPLTESHVMEDDRLAKLEQTIVSLVKTQRKLILLGGELSPQSYKIVSYLWERGSAPRPDIDRDCWDDPIQPDSARKAINRCEEELNELNEGVFLRTNNKIVTLTRPDE